jgi:hypothetical protein
VVVSTAQRSALALFRTTEVPSRPLPGVHELDPTTAVVSIITPEEMCSVRSAFCDHVHFFAGPTAARGWRAEHPGMSVVSVADAYLFGRPLIRKLPDGGPAVIKERPTPAVSQDGSGERWTCSTVPAWIPRAAARTFCRPAGRRG